MLLRTKTLLVIVIVLTCMLLTLFFISDRILLGNVKELELRDLHKNVERALNALTAEVMKIDVTNLDYSAWDDTYAYILSKDPYYIERNFTEDTITNLQINLLLYFDRTGNPIFAAKYDQNYHRINLDDEVIQYFRARKPLLHHSKTESFIKGILLLPDGPVVFSSRPIINSANMGPIRGTLIMARDLDRARVARLSQITQVTTEIIPLTASMVQKQSAGSKSLPAGMNRLAVGLTGKNKIFGSAVIQDAFGKPVLTLKVTQTREIYNQGLRNLTYFTLVYLATILVFMLTVFLLLGKMVISRVVNLAHSVDRIGETNDISARVAQTGTDEISRLAVSINKMLATIQDSQESLKYLSLHDSLTGLSNRTRFEQEMRRLEDSEDVIGVILGDIDGLKLINDTLGHGEGDKMLKAGAEILKKTFGNGEVISRIGGDEFAILMSKISVLQIEDKCSRIRDLVKKYNDDHPEFTLRISLGYAVSRENPPRMNELMKEADSMVYREKLHHRESARSTIVQTLMKTLEARDGITGGHADRLQDSVERMAKAIGLADSRIYDLQLFAQFHDFGKVGIPEHILFKEGPLDPEERLVMQRHSEIGYRIAQTASFLNPIADWILKHHEWWNGAGYPFGLKGEEIPLECRILAIADAYDAMTNDRPYRKALTRGEAFAELQKNAGVQFDPGLVEVFIRIAEGSADYSRA